MIAPNAEDHENRPYPGMGGIPGFRVIPVIMIRLCAGFCHGFRRGSFFDIGFGLEEVVSVRLSAVSSSEVVPAGSVSVTISVDCPVGIFGGRFVESVSSGSSES